MNPLHPLADPLTTEHQKNLWLGQAMRIVSDLTCKTVRGYRVSSEQWLGLMEGCRKALVACIRAGGQ